MTESNAFKLALVDIGNSWLKFSVTESIETAPESIKRVRWDEAFDLAISSEPHLWMIASVNRNGRERLQQILQKRTDDRILDLTYEHLKLETKVEFPNRTGIDRFCAAAGAIELVRKSNKTGPIIVADIGTAVTVDAVDADNCFLGGAIFLGPVKALQELGDQTDALPDISEFQLDSNLDAIGRDTTSALKAGAIYSLVGGLKELVRLQSKKLGQDASVVITGGGAPYVSAFVPNDWLVVEELVIHGIHSAAQKLQQSIFAHD